MILLANSIFQIPLLFQGGDSIVKRSASDAGVVEMTVKAQPPLLFSLYASKTCLLLD
jgi:hypothetical protein